ncbi:MAG: hypothetical protein AAF402_17485, partial [Pseudomonadota bacterium]
MTTYTYTEGDTRPNLRGSVAWVPTLQSNLDLTGVTAEIHVGPYATAAKPFFGSVTIENLITVGSNIGFDF